MEYVWDASLFFKIYIAGLTTLWFLTQVGLCNVAHQVKEFKYLSLSMIDYCPQNYQ